MASDRNFLIIKYTIFAFISIVINFLSQELCLQLAKISFFSKIIDFFTFIMTRENLIFYCDIKTKKEKVNKFTLYTLTGIVTTMIFWGFEVLFYNIFAIYYAKYIGATIGLLIGYIIKYHLDKKFVFKAQ